MPIGQCTEQTVRQQTASFHFSEPALETATQLGFQNHLWEWYLVRGIIYHMKKRTVHDGNS